MGSGEVGEWGSKGSGGWGMGSGEEGGVGE